MRDCMSDEGPPFGAVDFVCATSGLGQKQPSLANAQIVRNQTRGGSRRGNAGYRHDCAGSCHFLPARRHLTAAHSCAVHFFGLILRGKREPKGTKRLKYIARVKTQNLLPATAWRFKSSQWHQIPTQGAAYGTEPSRRSPCLSQD